MKQLTKKTGSDTLDITYWQLQSLHSNRPSRKSNPIPNAPDEEEDPVKPAKEDPSKKKKKKEHYEVTC